MAGFGSVIKNSLLYIILMAGITYFGAQLIAFGLGNIMSAYGLQYKSDSDYNSGVRSIWLGLLIISGLGGMFYMKAMSDVVEEGLIEF